MPAHIKELFPPAAVILYMASFPVWNPDLDRIETNRLEDCERLEKTSHFMASFVGLPEGNGEKQTWCMVSGYRFSVWLKLKVPAFLGVHRMVCAQYLRIILKGSQIKTMTLKNIWCSCQYHLKKPNYWYIDHLLLRTIDVQTCMSSNVEPSHFGEEQLHRFPKWSQQQQGEGPQPPKDACNLQRNRTFFNNNCWHLWNILAFSHFHRWSSFNIFFQLKTSFRSYTLCYGDGWTPESFSLSETISRNTWLNIKM